ncbi:pilus assembly protein PilM, partial [Candidatus Gottesmanbacteria bacterium]|nr:pilus assembly protein PilM [Candidatus Gottesmanbacteria bacterium]
MIYLDISDSAIEAVLTSDNILGGEKITSCARSEIADGLVINGLVVDPEKLAKVVQEIFTLGFPKAISDKNVAISISDKQVVTHRFALDREMKEAEISEYVVEQAKKILPYDPSELDNFFKVVGHTSSGKQVLYTACAKNTIVHFARFAELLGMKLVFLSGRSFAIYELVKTLIGSEEKILYANLDKKNAEYLLLDIFGPVNANFKKLGVKTFTAETKSVAADFEKEHEFKISKLILGGSHSLDIVPAEIAETVGIPVVKMTEVIDDLLAKLKIDLQTGGISNMLFAYSMGLMLLTHAKSPSNFAQDLKALSQASPVPETVSKKEEIKEEKAAAGKEDKSEKEMIESSVMADQVVEYKPTGMGRIFAHKILLVVIIIVLFLGGAFFVFGKNMQVIPFISSPTATPVPTVEPTLT